MPEVVAQVNGWGWVAAGYIVTYLTLAVYAGSLLVRRRRARERLEERR